MSTQIILTGLRANSEFHIGNYLGAILPMVELQNSAKGEYQLNMFVPDLHSFTTPIDHSKLQEQIKLNLKSYAAAGLDYNQPDTFVYRQSYIPAHSEMTLILNNFTYMGELSRMTQFKEKQGEKESENISAGLFDYPVLMAADVLLYGAHWVPVGEDQRQHLELVRDLGLRINNKFGELFTVPFEWKKQLEFSHRGSGVRIRSLRNPEKKMSKSIDDPAGTIMLSDAPEAAANKIISATTDSFGEIKFDMGERAGISNLLQIESLLSGKPLKDVIAEWEGKSGYGELKNIVALSVKDFLQTFQNKLSQVDENIIANKLNSSEGSMAQIARDKLEQVQKAVGLR